MEINVTVDNVDLNSVIGANYRQIGEEDYAETPQTLADVVADRIMADLKRDDHYTRLKERVREIRDEEIREQLRPIIGEAIAAPVQRTSDLGTPIGQPVALAELIVKEAQSFLARRDGYGPDAQTPAQKIIRDEVDRAIKSELSAAIADEKAKVVAAVRAKAADLIAEAVKQGVGR
jgi:hypothetical protein